MEHLRIVHFSITPLAGAPIRLVKLLRKHTSHDVNLIDLKRGPLFEHDIVFTELKDKAYEIANNADVIHLHNYIDLNTDAFNPINFNELTRKGVLFLRHFHSEPNTIASITGLPVSEVITSGLPSIVIAQYPERYFTRSRVVPNVIMPDEPEYKPVSDPEHTDILFTPSKAVGAWKNRWDTKGTPETIRILERVRKATNCRTKILHGKPLSEVLYEKQRARIIIDDLVTGSYHLSGMEALCQAKAVLTYLDHRIDYLIKEITGASSYPFINSRLENAEELLNYLVSQPELVKDIGNSGRNWIDRYWNEDIIVRQYMDVYRDLLQDPSSVKRQESLQIDQTTKKFFALILPDIIYKSNGTNYDKMLPLWAKFNRRTMHLQSIIRKWLISVLPSDVIDSIRRIKRGLK
jgi:hypothetical protein